MKKDKEIKKDKEKIVKNKQEILELEDYVNNLEKQLEKGFKGVITEINPITNKDFFGDTGTFQERNGYAVTVKLETNEEFNNWFSKPNLKGYEQSNLHNFKKKYNTVPKVGLEVECFIDENGFYRIKF